MKTFYDLTPQQKENILDQISKEIVNNVIEGYVEVELASKTDNVQLKTVLSMSRKQENPNAARQFIFNNVRLMKEFKNAALYVAEESKFDFKGELIKNL